MTTQLSDVDRDALTRAIAMARTYPNRGEQVDWKIEYDGWLDTAKFCAYLCQSRNLRLEIQEFPPCWLLDVDDTAGPAFKRKPEAAKLLRRLLTAHLSRFEPDPIAALAAAEKLQAAE